MDFLSQPFEEGFFDENVCISLGIDAPASFVIDDNEVFIQLIKWLQRIDSYSKPDVDDFKTSLDIVQRATNCYFGNLSPGYEESIIRSQKFDSPLREDELKTYSISDNKGGAMCAERFAVAHDMLLFLSIDSRYTCGFFEEYKRDTVDGQPEKVLNSFLVIKDFNGDSYIYDPTNPRKLYSDKDKTKLLDYSPYTIKIPEDQNIEKGLVVKGDFKIIYLDEGGKAQPMDPVERTYNIGQ